MTLDIVANNIYDRPIYFAVSVAPDAYLGLDKYFQLEGLTYRVVPKLNQGGSPYSAPARTDVMYERMMTKFKFGGIESNPNIYLDENNQRMTVNIKGNYGRLAEALIAKGEKEKAANIIDYSLKNMPPPVVPHSVFDFSYPEVYYQAGQKEKARKLVNQMMAKAKDELNYYKKVYQFSLSQAQQAGDMNYYQQLQQGAFMERREVREQLYIMQEMTTITKSRDDAEFSAAIEKEFTDYRYSFVQMPKPQ
jgi:tetratricopeptide (TPR) repeat protein